MDSSKSRVTITMPSEMLQEIDRQVRNRSRFILEAVERELDRRRQELLQASLSHPHPETAEFADAGLEEWLEAGSDESGLLDSEKGQSVRWEPGTGWTVQ